MRLVTVDGEAALPRSTPGGMASYGEWLARQGLSPNTIKARMRFYRTGAHGGWTSWPPPPEEIGPFLAGHTGWTRITYHTHLISVFDWLLEEGCVSENPARKVRRGRAPNPRPRPLSEEHLRQALAGAESRTRSFLMLGYLAGLRAHEIAKMQGRDIDQVHLRVIGKGGTDYRLPTHPLLWQLAERMPRDGWWFPSPYGDHIVAATVTAHVRRLFQDLGIEGATHRARHTYGTTLLRGGANLRVVQDLMRHSSLATTALYLGVDEDERVHAIRSLAA